MHLRATLALPILLLALAGCDDDGPSGEAGDGRGDAGSEGEWLDAEVDSELDASQDASSDLDAGAAADGGLADSALAADAGPKLRKVTIRFAGRVGTAEFACGTNYPGQGATATTITPVDLRFYVQDLKLVTPGGDEVPVAIEKRDPWQAEGVAMIDLENATGSCFATPDTNREITGYVPEGTYAGVRFANGVPESLNHGDLPTLPPPLRQPGMQWNWLLGYRFVKAEVLQVLNGGIDAGSSSVADGGSDAGSSSNSDGGADAGSGLAPDGGSDAGPSRGFGLVHTGAVGCSGNPNAGNIQCSKPNRNDVRFDHFDPDRNVIVLDIGALFGATDLSQDQECHSGATGCAPMVRLGIDIDTGLPLSSQQVYRVE